MATAKQTKQTTLQETPPVHMMIRKVGTAATASGAVTSDQADQHVSEWIDRGYKLMNTHFLGTEPDGSIFAFILVK